MLKRLFFIMFLCHCIVFTPPAFGGTETHGGDSLRLTLEKARSLAVEIVTAFRPNAMPSNHDVARWIEGHKADLIEELKESPIVLVDDQQEHEAMTELKSKAPIKVSRSMAYATLDTQIKAALLLLHESVHHLGVSDESFADATALALEKHYLQFGNTAEVRWHVFKLPAELQEELVQSTVFTDLEWALVTAKAIYLFNPVKKTWRQEMMPRASSIPAKLLWSGSELLVWGAGERQAQRLTTFGLAFNPTTKSWRELPRAHELPVISDATYLQTPAGVVRWQKDGAGDVYDLAKGTWRTIAAAPGNVSGRVFAASNAADPELLLLRSDQALIYNFRSGKWRQHKADQILDCSDPIEPCRRLGYDWEFLSGTVSVNHHKLNALKSDRNSPKGTFVSFDLSTGERVQKAIGPWNGPNLNSKDCPYEVIPWRDQFLFYCLIGKAPPFFAYDPRTNKWRTLNFADESIYPMRHREGEAVFDWTGESLLRRYSRTEAIMIEPAVF